MIADFDTFLEIAEIFPDSENAVLLCLGKNHAGQFVIWSETKSTTENLTTPRTFPFEAEARNAYQELLAQLTAAATLD